MDGVERIMVLGIFAVIVAILGVAAWSVTQDGDFSQADNQLVGARASAKTAGDGRSLAQNESGLTSRSGSGGAADGGASLGPASRSSLVGGTNPALRGSHAPQAGKSGLNAHRTGPAKLGSRQREDFLAEAKQQRHDTLLNQGSTEGGVNSKSPASGLQVGTPVARGDRLVRPESGRIDPLTRDPGAQGAKPAGAAPVVMPKVVEFEIHPGGSVWKLIKREYAVTGGRVAELSDEIEALNPNVDLNHVVPGQKIRCPNPALGAGKPVVSSKAPTPRVDAQPLVRQPDAEGFRLYTVQPGETLSMIAREQVGKSMTWQSLYEMNTSNIDDPDHLSPGITIKLPPQD